MELTKKQLITDLGFVAANFVLHLGADYLLRDKNAIQHLDGRKLDYLGKTYEYSELVKILERPLDNEFTTNQFRLVGLRTTTRETYEIIKNYCNRTGQRERFLTEDWELYVRIIRNALGHNFVFDFRGIKNNLFPVIWRSKQITLEMEGVEMMEDHFSYRDCFQLMEDVKQFAFTLD